MLNHHSSQAARRKRSGSPRRGVILVLAAVLLTATMAFAALVVDLGFILVVRSEMQTAADASALAAGMELADGYGAGAVRSQTDMVTRAKSGAVSTAAANRMLDRDTAYLSSNRDLEFGKWAYDPTQQKYAFLSGATPFTAVRATIRRDQAAPDGGIDTLPDGELNLFFARVMGTKTASYRTSAVASLKPGSGIRLPPGSTATADVLPITLDQQTWNNLLVGVGFSDNYRYNPETKTVSAGSDGIKEVNIYPYGNSNLPSGNRGTVDFGSSNNSTADLARQIRYGLNASDLAHFPNSELRFDNGPMIINGDTGISAGIKDDLAAIIGQPRAMPLFTSVSGPGNNAMYTIPKLVGVRIVYVKLTGSPSQKQVIVQPATFVSSAVFATGTETYQPDNIFSPVRLVQ